MLIIFVLIAVMVGAASTFGIAGTIPSMGIALAVLAAATGAMSIIAPSSGVEVLRRLARPGSIVVFIPWLWMLLQVAPIHPLSNAIWLSAASALKTPVGGLITVDIGQTLLSIAHYSAVLAVGVVAATVAGDRRAAKTVLNGLIIIAAFVALAQIASNFGYAGVLMQEGSYGLGATMVATIGVVLSCGALIQHRELPSGRDGPRNRELRVGPAGAALALAICATAMLVRGDMAQLLAALFGSAIPFSIFLIRKLLLGSWGKAGIAAMFAVAVLGSFVAVPMNGSTDVELEKMVDGQSATGRMISEARIFGSGAGSFEKLLPIYADVDEQRPRESPTAAAMILVEMGRTFFWCSLVLMLAVALLLCAKALSRNRDYIYVASGAGVIVACLITVFIHAAILTLTASIFAGAVLGLAFAQSLAARDQISNPKVGPVFVRVVLIAFSLFLAAQAVWVLAPERYLMSAKLNAHDDKRAVSDENQWDLTKAALIAVVRGDLWASSALAAMSALSNKKDGELEIDRVQSELVRAVRYAPCQSEIWLALATLAYQHKRLHYEPGALLKMAYYTGPNEVNLMPARIKLALRLIDAASDSELQDMVKRDVSLIFLRWPDLKPALADAYFSASEKGRKFAEAAVDEVEPSYLAVLRGQ